MFDEAVNGILVVLGCTYIFCFSALYWVLRRTQYKSRPYSKPQNHPCVSVVIPARNESARIMSCITALEKLTYPKSNYEIVFVDDGSTDNTADLIEAFAARHENWRLLRFAKPTGSSGPMLSIAHGVLHSRYDIILRTDADCQVKLDWVQFMTAQFDAQTAMVLGICTMKVGPGPIQDFLSFDNLVSGLLNSSFASLGFPTGCSGGNMAFRREAFNAVGGFDPILHFNSGEDTHLVHLFRKKKVGSVKTCMNSAGIVNTFSPERWRDVLNRMIRVNGETFKMNTTQITIRLAFLAGYVSPFILACNGWAHLGITMIGTRFMIEHLYLKSGAQVFSREYPILRNTFYQSVYPVYLAFFGFVGAIGKYKWR
jgi:cellulose synthase/poly-beta-1,6-N-acetylglucosamine synthase-like glycosyltransferase